MALVGQGRRWLPVVAVVVGLVIIGVVVFLIVVGGSEPEEVATGTTSTTVTTAPPITLTDAPAKEQAQDFFRNEPEPEADRAVAMGKALLERDGGGDGAFVLFEYAESLGHAEGSFYCGLFYDPLEDSRGSIGHDLIRAYECYIKALEGGHEPSREYLDRLMSWIDDQAAAGSQEALELQKKWQ